MNLKRLKVIKERVAPFLNRLRRTLAGSGASLGKRLFRAAPLIFIVVLLTIMLESGGWMRSLESTTLDTFLLLREPLEAKHVVIVSITQDDYKAYFGAQSPLDPAQVKKIVDAIAMGNPAVIGVDLDTSSPTFRELQPPPAPTVVWARDAERVVPNNPGVEGRSVSEVGTRLLSRFLPFLFKPEEERFSISNVLGRVGHEFPSGVALVPLDSDSTIRRYRRQFLTTEPDLPVMNSFSWATVKEYGRSTGYRVEETEESKEGWVLNSAVDEHSFKPISVKRLLEDLSNGEGWRGERGPVKNKIVLLGGMYPTSRDQHYTLGGPKYGVELLAYAIESDLQGKNIRPPNRYVVWLAELVLGFALVLVHLRFKERPKQVRYTVVAIPLFALLASFLVFSSLALWALFLPILLAVLIQQLSEDVREYREHKVHEIYKEAAEFGQDIKHMIVMMRDGSATATRSREGDGATENPLTVNAKEPKAEVERQPPDASAVGAEAKTDKPGGKRRGQGRRTGRKT